MTPPLQRVAVTGLGALSPAGRGLDALRRWAAAPSDSSAQRVPGFDGADYIHNPRRLRTMHRTFQLATAAAVMAMDMAGRTADSTVESLGVAPERAGLATALADISPVTPDLLRVLAAVAPELGRSPDGFARFAEQGAHELHPFRRLALLANMAAGHTSLLLNLQGPGFSFTSGAPAGLQVLTECFWTIAEGRADLMLAQSATSPEQSYTSARLPELAGAAVLENFACAERRGATILAELVPGARRPAPKPAGFEPAPELMAVLLRLADGGVIELSVLPELAAAIPEVRRA